MMWKYSSFVDNLEPVNCPLSFASHSDSRTVTSHLLDSSQMHLTLSNFTVTFLIQSFIVSHLTY